MNCEEALMINIFDMLKPAMELLSRNEKEPNMENPLCPICEKVVPTIVRCEACNDTACIDCAHEHFHYCECCRKLVCPKCIATKSDADYVLCNVCVEEKATEVDICHTELHKKRGT